MKASVRCSVLLDSIDSRQSKRTQHEAGEALAVESSEITGYANVTDGAVKLPRVLRDRRQQLVSLQFAPT